MFHSPYSWYPSNLTGVSERILILSSSPACGMQLIWLAITCKMTDWPTFTDSHAMLNMSSHLHLIPCIYSTWCVYYFLLLIWYCYFTGIEKTSGTGYADIQIHLRVSNFFKDVAIGMLSDDNFTKVILYLNPELSRDDVG